MTLNSKELKLLERINEDSSYSNWFFRQAKHKKWFFPLKDKGYFVPTAIPLDEDGHALFWPVLDYLERLSEQTEEHTEYAKELPVWHRIETEKRTGQLAEWIAKNKRKFSS